MSTTTAATEDTTAELTAADLAPAWAALDAPVPPAAIVAWAARTDIGRRRENNEDKYDFFLPGDGEAQPTGNDALLLAHRGRLWAVADGMGGHNAGQVASEAALKTLVRSYFAPSPSDIGAALKAAIAEADALLHRAASQFADKQGMGTTLVALALRGNEATIAHVGDSRVYLLRTENGKPTLKQLTTDHSWVEEQVRRGAMTRTQAEASPYRNYILRSVGMGGEIDVDVTVVTVQAGDTFLLCTDGLTGPVPDDRIAALLAGSPSQAALALIDEANANGGPDNITALVLRVLETGRTVGN